MSPAQRQILFTPSATLPPPQTLAVIMYGKDDCPYCEEAKAWLAARSITYDYRRINDRNDRDAHYAAMRATFAGEIFAHLIRNSMPLIMVEFAGDLTPIGGCDHLKVSCLETLFMAAPVHDRLADLRRKSPN